MWYIYVKITFFQGAKSRFYSYKSLLHVKVHVDQWCGIDSSNENNEMGSLSLWIVQNVCSLSSSFDRKLLLIVVHNCRIRAYCSSVLFKLHPEGRSYAEFSFYHQNIVWMGSFLLGDIFVLSFLAMYSIVYFSSDSVLCMYIKTWWTAATWAHKHTVASLHNALPMSRVISTAKVKMSCPPVVMSIEATMLIRLIAWICMWVAFLIVWVGKVVYVCIQQYTNPSVHVITRSP